MKSQIIIPLFFILLLTSSCAKDLAPENVLDPIYTTSPSTSSRKNASATVRTERGEVVLVLSNKDIAYPVNWTLRFPSEPYRTVIEYADVKKESNPERHYIYIFWLEPIETGKIIKSEKEASTAGSDPIGIVNDEFTSAEDGFLTIHYKINTSGNIRHGFSLAPVSSKNPYELVLLHDARGDAPVYSEEGLVAFPLQWLSPVNEKVKLKVSYIDLDNKLSTLQFEYGQ